MKSFINRWKNFMEGKLSVREASDFVKLLDSSKGRRLFSKAVKGAFVDSDSERAEFKEWNVDEQLAKLLEKKRNEFNKPRRLGVRMTTIYKGVAAAAAFGILVLGVRFLSETQPASVQPQVAHQPLMVTKYNPKGVKTKVRLPDKSVVYLNADSYLAYEEGFQGERSVWLVGEAFFEVAKDSLRPFQVFTGRLATTALGTSFNVNAYHEATGIQVTLSTGKVKVEDQESVQEMVLEPGEASLSPRTQGRLDRVQADPKAVSSWKEGVLQFEKAPMSEVILLLERWYDVRIKGPETWPDVKCSGTFRKNEYLVNVLKVLSHSIGFSYSIEGKEVIIQFQ